MKTKYPLFFRLFLIQLVAVLIGGGILFVLFFSISNNYLNHSIDSQRQQVQSQLDLLQEQWRTWKYMSLNDALLPALDQFKKIHQLDFLEVVNIEDLPKRISQYDIIVPQTTDPVINYVVHATLSQKNVSYIQKMHKLFLMVTVALIILFTGIIFITGRLLFKWYYEPIGRLNEAVTDLNAGDKLKIDHIMAHGAVGTFLIHLKQMTHFIRGYERMTAVGKMAEQIACVIKPYNAELRRILSKKTDLTRDDIKKMAYAVKGIENIINDLNEKNRRVHESLDTMNGDHLSVSGEETYSTQLLYSLVDTLVTEKRMQYHAYTNLRLDLIPGKQSYGMFVKVKTLTLRKILSNIIDLFTENSHGCDHIIVKLDGNYDKVYLMISDDISADCDGALSTLEGPDSNCITKFDKESILEKSNRVLRNWGGQIIVRKIEDRSFMICIELPRKSQQSWLLSGLELDQHALIVIVDDDKGIHKVWDNRLREMFIKPSNIVHFYKLEDFEDWFLHERKHTQLRSGSDTLLMAYEFLGQKRSGIDVIEDFKLKSRSVLVTNQYKRQKLQKLCIGLSIKILPKSLVSVLPIIVSETVEKPDCILISGDEHVQVYWRMEARLSGKSVLTFDGPEDFYTHINNYDRGVPIYVTTQLSKGVKGIDFSQEISKAGFKNIYMATTRDKALFLAKSWIKDVVDKEPPWKSA